MTGIITPRIRKLGRTLLALTLAIAALVLILSLWGRLPAVEARGPGAEDTGVSELLVSSSSSLSYYVFLPFVAKSDLVFFDDFSNSYSGWPHDESFEDCSFKYEGGTYRVKVTDNGQQCIIPNLSIPKQINGTFSVQMRRTSDAERPLLYGLIFGAGVDATEDRWALEIYPNISDCDDKPFYWLRAWVDGDEKYFEDKCTSSIDTGRNQWNELKIIRNGSNIKVFINDEPKGEFNNANYLLNQGYTLLTVSSAHNEEITVEFDNFEIRSRTTP